MRFIDDTFQNATNTLRNPDYTLFDLVLHYDWSHYRVALNIDNLGDRRVPDCIGANCTFSPGRVILGNVRYRW